MKKLCSVLSYKFRQIDLLDQALRHPSSSVTRKTRDAFERLEYLGDAVVQLVISEEIYHRFPDSDEGFMTKLRARVVSRPALADLGKRLGLGDKVILGKGEEANGGRAKVSTLANVFEAVVGAVYLDGGFDAAKSIMRRLTAFAIDSASIFPDAENPKGRLQEVLQSIRQESPFYELLAEKEAAAQDRFVVLVKWVNLTLGKGTGTSKKRAETAAAVDALKKELWKKLIENPESDEE